MCTRFLFCHCDVLYVRLLSVQSQRCAFLYTHPLVFGNNVCQVLSIKIYWPFQPIICVISHQLSSLHIYIPVSDIKAHFCVAVQC